jgi:hypothetical protein
MPNYLVQTAIVILALASVSLAQSPKIELANGHSVEINVTPLKDIAADLYEMCQSGELALPSIRFTTMVSFKIDPYGPIPKESIHILRSSDSKIIDTKAIEVVWRLGESHVLGPWSSLSSNSIELRTDENIIKLSMTGFSRTPDETKSRATQISFLLKLIAAQQRPRNPVVSELLSHFVIKTDNNRIDMELILPRDRAAEILRSWIEEKVRTPKD